MNGFLRPAALSGRSSSWRLKRFGRASREAGRGYLRPFPFGVPLALPLPLPFEFPFGFALSLPGAVLPGSEVGGSGVVVVGVDAGLSSPVPCGFGVCLPALGWLPGFSF